MSGEKQHQVARSIAERLHREGWLDIGGDIPVYAAAPEIVALIEEVLSEHASKPSTTAHANARTQLTARVQIWLKEAGVVFDQEGIEAIGDSIQRIVNRHFSGAYAEGPERIEDVESVAIRIHDAVRYRGLVRGYICDQIRADREAVRADAAREDRELREAQPDAVLIAAAPELAEALAKVLDESWRNTKNYREARALLDRVGVRETTS